MSSQTNSGVCGECSTRCKSGNPSDCTFNHRFSNPSGSKYYKCLECGHDRLTRADIRSTGIGCGADLAKQVAAIARINDYQPQEWKDTHRRKFKINERRDLLVTTVKATGVNLGIKALQQTLIAYYPRPVPGERLNHLIADGIGFEYPIESDGTRTGDSRLRNDTLRLIRRELLNRGFTAESHPVDIGDRPPTLPIDAPEWDAITEEYADLTTYDLSTVVSESAHRCGYSLKKYNGVRKPFSGENLKQILLTFCEELPVSQVARLVDLSYNQFADKRVPKYRICREIGAICGFTPNTPFSIRESGTRRVKKAELAAIYHLLENGLESGPDAITSQREWDDGRE